MDKIATTKDSHYLTIAMTQTRNMIVNTKANAQMIVVTQFAFTIRVNHCLASVSVPYCLCLELVALSCMLHMWRHCSWEELCLIYCHIFSLQLPTVWAFRSGLFRKSWNNCWMVSNCLYSSILVFLFNNQTMILNFSIEIYKKKLVRRNGFWFNKGHFLRKFN